MTTPKPRPLGITCVAALLFFAGIFDFLFGIWMALAPIGHDNNNANFTKFGATVPGWYLLINGFLCIGLGLLYLWLLRLVRNQDRRAQVLIQSLAVINIIFALLDLPAGWGGVALNLAILTQVSTSTSSKWFRSL